MNTYVPLPGSYRELLYDSRSAGPVDLSVPATITVRVRSAGDLDALEKKAYAESQKPLAERTYLDRDELTRHYGADPKDLDLVEQFAQKHNLFVASRHTGSRSIILTGKLGDILDAFPTDLRMYHHSTGTYRGRQGEIHIPAELNGILIGVFGLDTRPKQRAPHLHKSLAAMREPDNDGVTPVEFAKRYNFPTASGDTVLDGSGQTIAIIELGGGFRSTDLSVYFQKIGVPMPNVVSVSVDNAGNNPSTRDSADGEVMMDIEIAGAVAPKARIVVYFASGASDQGFLDAISAAVYDKERNPSVISISWGMPEDDIDAQALAAYHELFVAAASLGITVCVATGDHGVACLAADQWDGKIHVSHPSSDDYTLACGGTQIDAGRDVTWNDGTAFNKRVRGGDGWASTGGISPNFRVPDYQKNIRMDRSLAVEWPGPPDKSGRGVP